MTMRHLVLIRHAKAEAHGGDDAKRRLAPRGERDAREIGRWLKEAGMTSGVAAVSPARRTTTTWELAAEELGSAIRTTHDKRIYDNSVEDLLAVIQESAPQARTVYLVGHNPSIEALAAALSDGAGDPTAIKEMAAGLPTSAIAVFQTGSPWSALAVGGATLMSFAVPRG